MNGRMALALASFMGALAASPALADPPPGFPPAVRSYMAPNQPLDRKEAAGATLGAQWRTRYQKPTLDADGSVVWMFGLSQPSIVCSPLHYCDLALQPGEVISGFALGDPVRWQAKPVVSGLGAERVSHFTIKPTNYAEGTSLTVYTDRGRTYAVNLIFNQSRYTALTKFAYPDNPDTEMDAYRQKLGTPTRAYAGGGAANMQFYEITGDRPSWRPLHAYSDGIKTYIQFPAAMAYGEAPALLGLNDDGNFFHSPSERSLPYRTSGDMWIVDSVVPRLELVLGVGSHQTKVLVEKSK